MCLPLFACSHVFRRVFWQVHWRAIKPPELTLLCTRGSACYASPICVVQKTLTGWTLEYFGNQQSPATWAQRKSRWQGEAAPPQRRAGNLSPLPAGSGSREKQENHHRLLLSDALNVSAKEAPLSDHRGSMMGAASHNYWGSKHISAASRSPIY